MKLIFIPFQDEPCFLNNGILTREYAMLKLIKDAGYEPRFVINKPRTILDHKEVSSNERLFPLGSIEHEIKQAIDAAQSIFPFRELSLSQITMKRGWWVDGYLKALDFLPGNLSDYLVYSNTPFSWKLIEHLKQRGATILFDSMDNMAIYPHFWMKERAAAHEGYSKLLEIANFSCANSQRTVDYFKSEFDVDVELIKNGVFQPRLMDSLTIDLYDEIAKIKQKYRHTVGFIGKFGFRIDHTLIDELANKAPDLLFVLIGPELDGQCSEINKIVTGHSNILKYPGVPSAYLYKLMSAFDSLMIPYSVGENENSGDPLKLYQYLLANKPIACTPIREVAEFSDYILISDNSDKWLEFFDNPDQFVCRKHAIDSILWSSRAASLIHFIKENGCVER